MKDIELKEINQYAAKKDSEGTYGLVRKTSETTPTEIENELSVRPEYHKVKT